MVALHSSVSYMLHCLCLGICTNESQQFILSVLTAFILAFESIAAGVVDLVSFTKHEDIETVFLFETVLYTPHNSPPHTWQSRVALFRYVF